MSEKQADDKEPDMTPKKHNHGCGVGISPCFCFAKEPGVNPLTGHKRSIQNLRPNRNGRTPGSKNKVKNALTRMQKDPVQELITIAMLLRTDPPESQRKALEVEKKIWEGLLEYELAKKKPSTKEEKDPEESKKAAEVTFDLLKELENENVDTRTTGTSNKTRVDDRKPGLETETSSEEDLQDNQGQ